MEFKEYQQRVVDLLEEYLVELAKQAAIAKKIAEANAQETDPDLVRPIPDFSKRAWDALRSAGKLPASRNSIEYSPRQDGIGIAVPNLCLKIPTGGGKTLLGVNAISRIFGLYLSSNTGFVLWVVPNEAIYSQTKKLLTDRDHPYRQMLDRAAAGKVKILEKESRLDRRDVETHLCVMLLMLQSANRETKEALRLFRDRGNVHGFFPNEGEADAHAKLLASIPNLDGYREGFWPIVKDSLGNVLRFVRPVVIIDEGHKAYSTRAMETIYGFNPSIVLELSATPKDRPTSKPPRYANWLVDVRGKELSDEEMIKLPINVKVKSGDDWRDCLRESLELLDKLQASAETLQANCGRYIRPILLVQVERTGNDQREAGFIHADDARDYLLSAGLAEREIAVKTSQVNDLAAPENRNLLSPTNTVRVIITKQALQEGWDCPFAYVLCALSANRNLSAMTQLVGRILRQPQATKTKVQILDECYVMCHHAQTKQIVEAIKTSLEQDGMADLALQIREHDGTNGKAPISTRKVVRRNQFKNVEIFLPVVNWVDGEVVRPLDYEQDILSWLDWSAVNMSTLADKIPTDGSHLVQTQMTRIALTDGAEGEFFQTAPTVTLPDQVVFDSVYTTRIIADLVCNAWVARELIRKLVDRLRERGFTDESLGAQSSFILEELRKFLIQERDRLAEDLFLSRVGSERIQFRLRTDRHNWRMPHEVETDPEGSPQLPRPDGMLTVKSLFSPVYTAEYNKDEAEFACYLDEVKALQWWHRNVAKAGQYFVQGWRKSKVYPDFVFALIGGDSKRKLVVMETKGDQLRGNLDTEYKRRLLKVITDNFAFENVVKAGELELVVDKDTSVACDLVLISEWKTEVPNRYFGDQSPVGQELA